MAAVECEQPASDQLNVTNNTEENVSINSEGDSDDIIERLHDVTALTIPDRDIPSSLEDSDSIPSTEPGDNGSVGAVSNTQSDTDSQTENRDPENGEAGKDLSNGHSNAETDSTKSDKTEDSCQSDNKQNDKSTNGLPKKKNSNPVKGLLRKLTKSSSKSSESKTRSKSSSKRGSVGGEDLTAVTIDKLPQCFIVKYLGKRECSGLWGIKHVRKPVDEMVKKVTKQLSAADKAVELPLMYLVVSPKGLELREHPNNRVKDELVEQKGSFPIDFISYGVQDLKFWRVFTFIVVQELSARSKKMDCHAFICDSSVAARKVAVSLAFAFKVNMRKLKQEGKEHRFQVDLRPPDELADKYTESSDQDETEAAEC